MNSKHKKTVQLIFDNPIRSDVRWSDIERLFVHMGGTVQEGAGSRVLIKLNGKRAVFHRPHPERVTDKGALKRVREFLLSCLGFGKPTANSHREAVTSIYS